MLLRSIQNALAFYIKCTCVFLKAEYVPGNPFISVRTIPFSLRFLTFPYARIRTRPHELYNVGDFTRIST